MPLRQGIRMPSSQPSCVGIPKEIKEGECRVAGLPQHVHRLVEAGTRVVVQRSAGVGAGYDDDAYRAAGADLVHAAEDVYEQADVVWKVKEVLPAEYGLLRRGQVIFTYLHAAPRPEMTEVLRAAGCVAVAYEEMRDGEGRRPLLAPMSRMAGAGAVAVSAQLCQTRHGGCGKLLFHTEGTAAMTYLILGAGVAGQAAARAALGAGARVFLLEVIESKLEGLRARFGGADVVLSDADAIRRLAPQTDVFVNCTYWMPGDPHVITRDMLSLMQPRSLIMDVAADPKGAVETSETTTHDEPVREVDGILHYCVPNIPALFARSASQALSAVTWPYLKRLATEELDGLLRDSAILRSGVVTWRGQVVGEARGRMLAHGASRTPPTA